MPPPEPHPPLIDIEQWSSFTRRTIAAFLASGLMIGGLLTIISLRDQRTQLRQSLMLRGETIARSLGRAAFVPLLLEDGAALEALAQGFKEEAQVVAVALYGAQGEPLVQIPVGKPLPPPFDAASRPTDLFWRSISFTDSGGALDFLLPLKYAGGPPAPNGAETMGYVRVVLSEEGVRRALRLAILKNILLCLGVMTAALLLGARQINIMTRQLREFIEQVQLTAELKRTNKELESFSYSVSHDLRAPLRSIDGFSQSLLEDFGDRLGPEGKHDLERVRAGCQRMSELIDDLLGLSQVIRREMHLENVDLSAIARTAVEQLARTEAGRSVELIIPEKVMARGDAGLLRNVMENLLGNAWKFTRKTAAPRIEFGVSDIHGRRTYFVRDNGAGFNMEYSNKLFGVFQRLHDGKDYPGTGIGLATVNRIIQRHQGRIWAEAEEGRGATFYFTLP